MIDTKSQRRQIFFHLLYGYRITGIGALTLFGCMRLGARIFELKELGIPIEDRFITVVGKNGKTKRVKEYWIEPVHFDAIYKLYEEGRIQL